MMVVSLLARVLPGRVRRMLLVYLLGSRLDRRSAFDVERQTSGDSPSCHFDSDVRPRKSPASPSLGLSSASAIASVCFSTASELISV
jgi:hypothetical protein